MDIRYTIASYGVGGKGGVVIVLCYTKRVMIIAVDTGGTKTLVARFSQRGTLEKRVKFPTPKAPHEYLDQLHAAILHLSGRSVPRCISLALPDITTSSYVEHFTNLPWEDFDVAAMLAPLFPKSPIVVGNDAKIGGLGEVRSMSPQPARALYVTVSTGIGTGLIVNGKIEPDLLGMEGGHMLLEHRGALKTWESFASGRAIHRTYRKYGSEIESPRIWRQIAKNIEVGLLALSPVLRPEVIIIGGSIGAHFHQYGAFLNDSLQKRLPKPVCPQVLQAIRPEEAVIYGCYYNALDTLAA